MSAYRGMDGRQSGGGGETGEGLRRRRRRNCPRSLDRHKTASLQVILRAACLGIVAGGPDDPPSRSAGSKGAAKRRGRGTFPPGSRGQLYAKVIQVIRELQRRARAGDPLAQSCIEGAPA